VNGYGDCIWLQAYERLKYDGRENSLLEHAPVTQNQGLRGTSAWANFWLGRDHAAKRNNNSPSDTKTAEGESNPSKATEILVPSDARSAGK
jgi:methylenetetrahydrofolate reductase (NADPH)